MSVLGRCINNEMPMTPRLFRCENTPDRQKKNYYISLFYSAQIMSYVRSTNC